MLKSQISLISSVIQKSNDTIQQLLVAEKTFNNVNFINMNFMRTQSSGHVLVQAKLTFFETRMLFKILIITT